MRSLTGFSTPFESFMADAEALRQLERAVSMNGGAGQPSEPAAGASAAAAGSSTDVPGHQSPRPPDLSIAVGELPAAAGGVAAAPASAATTAASPPARSSAAPPPKAARGPSCEPALVAFAKARRPEWLAWLGEPGHGAASTSGASFAGRALLDPEWGKPLLDPARYPLPTLEAFRRDQEEPLTGANGGLQEDEQEEARKRIEGPAEAEGIAPLLPTTSAPCAGPSAAGSRPVRHLVLLCVHAHNRFTGPAAVPAVRRAFGDPPTTLVALPCCARFHPGKDIGRPPDLEYHDSAIFSAKRKILIWKWEQGKGAGL